MDVHVAVWVPLCVCGGGRSMGVCRFPCESKCPKKPEDGVGNLELELKADVRPLTWVLGTKFCFF